MATNTTKWNLRKPTSTDLVVVEQDIGDNMQKIDDGAVALQNSINSMQSVQTAYRNVIRNGDMSIRQRGISGFTASGVYTVDGWFKNNVDGTHTISPVNESLQSGGGMNGAKASIQSVVSGQANSVIDYAYVSQRIESVRTLAGQQVTLSFIGYAISGSPKIGIEVEQFFGTGGSPSATLQTSVSAITLNNTFTRYSVTFTIPSIVGKSVGTSDTDYLCVYFWLSAGSNFSSRSSNIGIQNTTIYLTDVQLEAGSSATPFERLPQQVQLAWCQRYCYIHSDGGAIGACISPLGIAATTVAAYVPYRFPVTMRAVPTIFFSGTFNTSERTANTAVTNLRVTTSSTKEAADMVIDTAGSLVVGRGYSLFTASVNGYVGFSAEL